MAPLVNVLIANYNYAEWLEGSIMSAINQTYENLMVTVVDSASTDDSWSIIESLCPRKSVYREGDIYDRGDTSTWGGSLWHCQEDGVTAKPGTDEKSWKLAVKKGADGKHGVNGIDKTAPVKMQ